MKHIYVTILSLFILGACRQQESELMSTSTPVTVQDTVPQDTATPAVQEEPPAIAACQLHEPLLLQPDTVLNDPSLRAYLQELKQAVTTQNLQQLQGLVDPNIRTSFGENGGWNKFAKQWNLEDKQADAWLLLDHLLRLGGGYPVEGNRQLYALPYVYSNWPDSVDAFMHVAVIKDNAILREEPVANAAAKCTLGQVILKVDYGKSYPEGAPQKEWWHVQSPDGELQGYLHRSDVHSPVGYRAILNKNKQGQWHMTALVTGD